MLILREVPRPGVRLSAGLAAADTTAALAIAHTAAGGALPSGPWLLAIAATSYGAGLLVLRGRAKVRMVLPAMVGLQVLLHAWLLALTAGADVHLHASGSSALLGLTWPMLLAHVSAGLVAGSAWVLRRRAVDVLLGWVAAAVLAVPLRRRVRVEHRTTGLAGHFVAARPTRGPPQTLPAAA